jgi:hypothetical protein
LFGQACACAKLATGNNAAAMMAVFHSTARIDFLLLLSLLLSVGMATV